jgi:hypothetical protein
MSGWFQAKENSTPAIAGPDSTEMIIPDVPGGVIDPAPIPLDWPVDLPWIPDQPGAKAEFDVALDMAHGEQMYEVELRCLNEATVEGRSLRWLQTRILDLQSGGSESAWLLIDANLYETEQTLLIHQGFLEASLPEGAMLPLVSDSHVVRRWSAKKDPMLELAEQAGFEWPLTRISTMTLLSVLFDMPHPTVSPHFRELRSRLNAYTDLSIDRTTFVTKHGEVPAVRATATPKTSSPPQEIGYVVERAEDYRSTPFSLLSVEIHSESIHVMFKRAKDSLESLSPTIELERLESAAASLESFLDEEPQDFSRAILPDAEGAWAKYDGFVKRGPNGRELTFEVEVRAGSSEQDHEGRSYRWIEMLVRSGATDKFRTDQGEGVALLIDEDAYRSRGEFQIQRGWYLRDGESFQLETADLGQSEGLFRWLHPLALIDRFSVQEALAVLFDAPIPSTLPNAAPLTGLRSLISGRLVQADAHRNWKRLILKTPSGKQAFGYVWTVDATEKAGLGYTIQWSQAFPFGFGNVYFNYPNLFTISTELKDYQSDHVSLFATDDELSRRAEATRLKLSDAGVRTWAEDSEKPITGRYHSASKLSVRIETPVTAFNGQIMSKSFTDLPIADREWVYECNSPRTWKSKNHAHRTKAALLGFAGVHDERTIREEISGSESKLIKVLLLQDLQAYLDHPANAGKASEQWAPIEVHWYELSEEDRQYIRDHWSPPRSR